MEDPRSSATGRKIRKIEPGRGNDVDRPGDLASGSRPGPGMSDPEPLNGAGAQRRSLQPRGPRGSYASDGSMPMDPPPGSGLTNTGAQRMVSLPPLSQTGEIPKQGLADSEPSETVVVPQVGQDGFEGFAPSGAFSDDRTQQQPTPGFGPAASMDTPSPSPGNTVDPFAPPRSRASSPDRDQPFGDQNSSFPTGDPPRSALVDRSSTSRPSEDRPSANSGVGMSAAAITAARLGHASGATPSGRPTGRPRTGAGTLDDPSDLGQPLDRRDGAPRRDRFIESGGDRLQDTEFKLAAKRPKQKPKEPNKLVLGFAAGLVILVGLAVAFFMTRDDGDSTEADAGEVAATETTLAQEAPEAQASLGDDAAAPVTGEPTFVFPDAEAGPLLANTSYSIDLQSQPEGSQLQVVVDGALQGEPAALLPDLRLPAGRHSIYVDISSAAGVTSSNTIDFYVIGPVPAAGWRANLSSVNILEEGWVEALRQYDEFAAAGHENLRIFPISDGYWNIFVPELGEEEAQAKAYCESFGLAIPDACFVAYLDPAEIPELAPPDPSAPAEDNSTATTDAPEAAESTEEDPQTSTTDEAMVDEGGETADGDGG